MKSHLSNTYYEKKTDGYDYYGPLITEYGTEYIDSKGLAPDIYLHYRKADFLSGMGWGAKLRKTLRKVKNTFIETHKMAGVYEGWVQWWWAYV